MDMIEISNKANWELIIINIGEIRYLYKISIVLPTLNGFPHIKKAINSILNQSHKNWELIIVNDGSTQPELKGFLDRISKQQNCCNKFTKKWRIT